MYPSIIVSDCFGSKSWDDFRIYNFNGITLAYVTYLEDKVLVIDNPTFLIFAHVNESTRKSLNEFFKNEFSTTDILHLQEEIHWGFICIINKLNRNVQIINDLFGIYPLYFSQTGEGFSVSNDFDLLMSRIGSAEININGLYDYLLFNYTLNNNTLVKEISQLSGGSIFKVTDSKVIINGEKDIAQKLITGKRTKADVDKLLKTLKDHVASDLDPGKPIILPLSGGFDSKVILSILLSSGKDFSAFTFGAKGSVDHKTAAIIAKQFNIKYRLLETDVNFLNEADRYIRDFIDASPGMPLILDLLSYGLVKQEMPSSNVVTGIMGGEIIGGPVVISEVIVTRFAALLTKSESIDQFRSLLLSNLKDFPLLDYNYFEKNAACYAKSLVNYFSDSTDIDRKNLINFLLKETYGKFFGVVFRNLFHKFNIINPFTNMGFLRILLNSDLRFTKIHPFSKNPLSHYFSKRIIPAIVKMAYKPVLYTPMDRGYKLADALYLYRFPRVIFFYIKNKIFKKNKTENLKTINYTRWLTGLIRDRLLDSAVLKWPVFDGTVINKSLKNPGKESDYILRKMILILGLHYFNNKYGKKLKFNSEERLY